jgi:hypothetical protein
MFAKRGDMRQKPEPAGLLSKYQVGARIARQRRGPAGKFSRYELEYEDVHPIVADPEFDVQTLDLGYERALAESFSAEKLSVVPGFKVAPGFDLGKPRDKSARWG